MGAVADKIAHARTYLLKGPGLFLFRGLPVAVWGRAKAAMVFWGIGAHMGLACLQNGKGHVLGHVKNLGLDYADPATRGYQTSARLPYHTDSSDIVGLLCLKTARSGGLSSVVSSTTLYNEMARRNPDLLRILMEPFHRTRWGEIPEGKDPWARLPVFMPFAGRVIAHYVRSAIRKGQLLDGVPPMTAKQTQALDLLDTLAEDPDLHLDMTFEPVDIQLVCNHSTFHSRTAYEDHEDPMQRRHLLRLWLACDDGPPLPHWMTESYEGKTRNGRPNGIVVPGIALNAPLEAE
ncbi:MAG: TauD/TfdA family dioxygenase [Hyphomicrobiaceae bacterium]